MAGFRIVGQCPACSRDLEVSRLHCTHCDTAVEGHFTLSRFDLLSEPQTVFLELFLSARGNIREVERMLGLSYPAVRSRLDQVLKTLGLASTSASDGEDTRRLDVLEGLKRGHLSVEDAIQELKKQF